MKINPKVSIVIPVYNGSNYVGEAIESAIAQTYSNTEIIVVNDGSCDNGATENIVLSYKDKVRYLTKPNGGVASALNAGIESMKGSYFSWLSHDDLYHPQKIEKQINFLSQINDSKAIAYCDFESFCEDPLDTVPCQMWGVSPEHFRYWITIVNGLHGCTLLIPKSAFKECGLFDERLKTTQDYDLWFRFAEKYNFVHKSDILVKARFHPEQGTHKLRNTALIECDELLTKFVKELKRPELIFATKKIPKFFYADIASNMKSRGFQKASKAAKALEKNLPELNSGIKPDSLQAEYAALQTVYVSLQTEHDSLQQNYNILNEENIISKANYNYLQFGYDALQANYNTLQLDFSSLQLDFRSLKVDFSSLQYNHDSLQGNYNSLLEMYNRLNGLLVVRIGKHLKKTYRKFKSYVK